jgi:phage gpG-like protein
MVGITVQIEGEAQVARAFHSLEERLSNLYPAWPAVAEAAREHSRARFAAQGPGWPGLSEAYAARKSARYGAQKILHAEGRLEASLTQAGAPYSIYLPGPEELTVGSSHRAAHAHHAGNDEAGLPARPVYDLEGDLAERAVEAIERELTELARDLGLAA